MSSGKGVPDFPNVEAKLQKPTKQSAFEKQRVEAEAKRQREAAETAAVLEDFVKSFDHDDNDDRMPNDLPPVLPRPAFSASGGSTATPGASRRHFGSSALKSGPGSLGPPPTSFAKKRSFQDFSRGPRENAVPEIEQSRGAVPSIAKAFDTSDDDDMTDTIDRAQEKATARPTLRLLNLPPGTSLSMIKALMPSSLTVENVKILPPAVHGGFEKKCQLAIVTLSQETPANELDGAVSALQDRYLGYGYHLSLHRHLSSAVTSTSPAAGFPSLSSTSQPFGAKPVEQNNSSLKSSAQQGSHRGFAPPSSYGQPPNPVNRSNLLHVPVQPPENYRTIQLINKAVEGLLEHGPDFEALLMSRPEVQREEKWAWLWDARSRDGIWYRWKLWEVVTGLQLTQSKGKFFPLFDGGHAWKSPATRLAFEYTTQLDDFISDSDYSTSDEDDAGGDETRGTQAAQAEKTFLNPMGKARLTHLLTRLPTTLSNVRKGDIARVTGFAIKNASCGADEMVDLIVSNLGQPFSLTRAKCDNNTDGEVPPQLGAGMESATVNETLDNSAACLVGLYVVNDVLLSSSTSGVRHAWRFRQLFETALQDHRVFDRLGSMPEKLSWGRMRADKWKRSVTLILNIWEQRCVFPAETRGHFVSTFDSPPSLKIESKAEAEDKSKRGRWKVVETAADNGDEGVDEGDGEERESPRPMPARSQERGRDGIYSRALGEDGGEGKGKPTGKADAEDTSMDQGELQEGTGTIDVVDEAKEAWTRASEPEPASLSVSMSISSGRPQPRKRMRAVDMFADSDNSE